MENKTSKDVETAFRISYQFTPVPTKLFLLLDNNCRSMLFTLIQLNSCFSDESGYFFRSNSDLQQESNLSKNLVIVVVDTLYTCGIIDVKCISGKSKTANYYKLNFDKIKTYENLSLEETKNPKNKIYTLNYKGSCYSPSYLKKEVAKNIAKSEQQKDIVIVEVAKEVAKEVVKSEQQKQQKVNTNIYSIDIENIYNKENSIYNNTITENVCSNENTGDLSNPETLSIEVFIPMEIMPENSNKQVDNNTVSVPTMEEVNKQVFNDIDIYLKPTSYNGKGLVWYEVINTMQCHANEIRNYISNNVADIEIKNKYLSTINEICKNACDEIRDGYSNKVVA